MKRTLYILQSRPSSIICLDLDSGISRTSIEMANGKLDEVAMMRVLGLLRSRWAGARASAVAHAAGECGVGDGATPCTASIESDACVPGGVSSFTSEDLPKNVDLVVTAAGTLLYWVDQGLPDRCESNLHRAQISATGLHDHAILARGFSRATGLAVDPQRKLAYVGDLDGRVRVVCLTDGISALIHQCEGPISGIALQLAEAGTA